MAKSPYKKDWLVSTGIARGMISTEISERLPTLSEYCEAFGCSRGVVQNAIASLESCGAIQLNKCGKQGTFLLEKNEELLFAQAGLSHLTGSMPTPLNIHLAGLATGICQAMGRCSIPFTFAFIQGGKNRADALSRQIYDFVVVTRATARGFIEENPDLEEVLPFSGCTYSQPYLLYMNTPGLTEIQDGMSVALDPSCHDQCRLTMELCHGKDVKFIEMPYISSRQAFFLGEVDALVFRDDSVMGMPFLNNLIAPSQRFVNPDLTSSVPIELDIAGEMQLPVVLVNKKNYGMSGILRSYLGGDVVSFVQKKVVDLQMSPQFF